MSMARRFSLLSILIGCLIFWLMFSQEASKGVNMREWVNNASYQGLKWLQDNPSKHQLAPVEWLANERPPQPIKLLTVFKFTPLNNRKALRNVLPGGEYRPKGGTSSEITAVIVPYRDRQMHREVFLRHMHSFLQKQQLHYMIFFVEMAKPTIFNRGLLANVGFSIAKDIRNFSCFIVHDVDLMPMNEELRYICDGSIHHFSVENSKYNYSLPYKEYVGGVIAIPGDLYKQINGFSNTFFGWGGEDDELALRVQLSNLTIKQVPGQLGRYFALNHTADRGNPVNPDKDKLICTTSARWKTEGLNTLQFKELKREARPLYTWIYIDANETAIMKTIPMKCPSTKKIPRVLIALGIAVVVVVVVINKKLTKLGFRIYKYFGLCN